VPARLALPRARYRCTGCGDCCRGWDVPLAPGEADAFRALAAPLVPVERLRATLGRATQAGRSVDTIAASRGRCAALADDNLCLIHGQHGGDAKPRACRIFPFTFVATPGGVRVGLSFACPAVLDGEGPTLDEQRDEIAALFAGAVDGTHYLLHAGPTVPLDARHALAWPDAEALLAELDGALAGDGPLGRRAAAAAATCALVQLALDEGRSFAAALARARGGRDAVVAEELAAPPEVDRLSRAMLRTLVRSTEPARGVARSLAALVGAKAVRLREPSAPTAPAPVVAWAAVERTAPGLGADGEALLGRWLAGALSSLTFFGDAAFDLPIAGGLELLILSAAVAAFLARARAAHAGRDRAGRDDLALALRQLEAGVTHRSSMPRSFARALAATASLDLLREQLG
jgi:Fe-S-cluster containining protein